MYRITGVVLLLLPALPVARAEDKPNGTPEQQYWALVQHYRDEVQASKEAYESAKAPQDRQKALAKWPQGDKLAPKFLELAEKSPKDLAALNALMWVVVHSPARGNDSPRAKAWAILGKDWVESPKIGPACGGLVLNVDKQTENFLRAVLDKNPSRKVRGVASWALAAVVAGRASTAEILKGPPPFPRYHDLGKDDIKELMRLDIARAYKEAEDLYERAAGKYGDVQIQRGLTVADAVKPQLFSLRHLANGKQAPEIEGEDIDGKKFKLSDYRGKVVLLVFWGEW